MLKPFRVAGEHDALGGKGEEVGKRKSTTNKLQFPCILVIPLRLRLLCFVSSFVVLPRHLYTPLIFFLLTPSSTLTLQEESDHTHTPLFSLHHLTFFANLYLSLPK